MKKLSFRGKLDIGTENKINLRTPKGKTGYKITKLQAISTTPGATAHDEILVQVFSKSQVGSIGSVVDFTDSELLAVNYYEDNDQPAFMASQTIIFDNQPFNQNIFISATDIAGGTKPVNYYIEIETMELTDVQSTQLTLKNLRTITS